jgi:hypothetical protein
MKSKVIETGDLELLALGILSEEKVDAVLLAINNSEKLKLEYIDIQRALLNLSLENGIAPPDNQEELIKEKLFKSKTKLSFPRLYKSQSFRIAAALLIVGSMAANFYLFSEEVHSKDLRSEIESEDFVPNLLAELPFDKSMFEEMFQYLEKDLMTNPCKMNFSSTQSFLETKGLNTNENLAFLKNNHAHCDCEVLMNVSQLFVEDYSHGHVAPVSHRSPAIKLSYFQISSDGPLLAFDAINGKLLF